MATPQPSTPPASTVPSGKRRRSPRLLQASHSPKRHRPSPSSTRLNSPPTIWLDLLPSDISLRIATLVVSSGRDDGGTRRTDSALHLAQTSPSQRRAILAALDHAFTLHGLLYPRSHVEVHAFVDRELQWMSLFKHDIRKLYLARSFGTLSLRRAALALLTAPQLRSARVPDDPRVLHAIARCKSLHSLTVYLKEGMDAIRLLMRSLAALRLRKLVLVCSVTWELECPLPTLHSLRDSSDALARCCPQLQAFYSRGCRHSGDSYWAIWSSLPNIREVDVTELPPEWVIPQLRTVHTLRIRGIEGGLSLAGRLGACVTQLFDAVYTGTMDETEALSECKRMSKLHLVIGVGGEISLVKAVPMMSALRSLTLHWTPSSEEVRKIEFFHPVCAEVLPAVSYWHVFSLKRYNEVTTGVMLHLVQQARALTHLDILGVRIRVTEVVAILKHLGGRLKRFGVSFHDQHESAVDRFKTLVETISEHNRGLRRVSCGNEKLPSCLRRDGLGDCDLTSDQKMRLNHGRKTLQTLMMLVRHRVPFLDVASLDKWITVVLCFDVHEM